MDELLQDFIAETRETLEAIGEEIVAWEATPRDRARLDTIFRFVHTVKGSCGFLDLPRLERLSHAAEDALAEVRADRRTADHRLVDAVLAVIDRITELVAAIENGVSLDDGDDSALIAALSSERGTATTLPSASALSVTPRAIARSIRVPIELLDRMMAGVSDLVLARNEIGRVLQSGDRDQATASSERLSAAIDELRDAVTRTRMARIDYLFAALPRTVRDLSAELGKEVRLEIDGGDVELDREMIEMIRDPLLHIVRNAIDHGFEPPAERIAAGKPRFGTLRVSARQAGNQIEVEIADDGRGIDETRVLAKALALGVVAPADADRLSTTERRELIFAPGLSTATVVTAVSGRGVGMDVVRANIERLGGTVALDGRIGQGTRLTLSVPLTLTIIPALTVVSGGQCFAIPRVAVEEIVRIGPNARRAQLAGAALAVIRGERMPLVDLADMLGLRAAAAPLLVVLRPGGVARYALGVEAVRDHEELVVKPTAPAVAATGLYAGVTMPDDSRPLLLLDPSGIAARAGIGEGVKPAAAPAGAAGTDPARMLLFRELDGRERGMPLGLIERIEDAPAAAFAVSAGRVRLARDGRLVPVVGLAAPPAADRVRVLRIAMAGIELAYPIDAVVDVVALPEKRASAAVPGPVLGAVLIDGRPVELIDAHWLLAQAADVDAPDDRPLAILEAGEDGWMRDILRPLVEAAGYRVALGGETDPASARVVLTCDDAATAGDTVVRLSREPIAARADAVWRYDRAGLLGLLAARKGGR